MSQIVSVLTGGDNLHETTSEEVNALATDLITEGVVGAITDTSGVAPMTGSHAVNAQGTPDMTVAITAGNIYVTATPTGQSSQTLRVRLTANENLTISANASGSTKYDWIYVKIDADAAADPAVGADDVADIVASRSSSASTDDGTPPTYGTLIAVVTVSNGASSITNGNIADKRVRANPKGINDDNGNEVVKISSTANAVNELTLANAATGNGPEIQATGSDTNIDIELIPKGSGEVTKNSYPIDWWEEIGRTTLGSAADSITVSSLPAKKYLKVLILLLDTGGTVSGFMTFNSDTGTNYTRRDSDENGADTATASTSSIRASASAGAWAHLVELNILNVSAEEKLVMGHAVGGNTAGDSAVNRRTDISGKWDNVAAQISAITISNGGTGDYNTGSEIVVLGHN